jgi:hypothetical protein
VVDVEVAQAKTFREAEQRFLLLFLEKEGYHCTGDLVENSF